MPRRNYVILRGAIDGIESHFNFNSVSSQPVNGHVYSLFQDTIREQA